MSFKSDSRAKEKEGESVIQELVVKKVLWGHSFLVVVK